MSAPDVFSGERGTAGRTRAALADLALDALAAVSWRDARLARAARTDPPTRRVLALAVERRDRPGLLDAARAELAASRHDVRLRVAEAGGGGRFENLNRLLAAEPVDDHDWLLVLDDDVGLPRGFVDRFLFLCERFDLRLAQPAHRWRSHAAWPVTRRRPGAVVRETSFVEIGPVTAFAAPTFDTLLPFPPLRYGWGLDAHWAAVARDRGWRMGVVDALPISHLVRLVAGGYEPEAAVAEAAAFLAGRPHLTRPELGRTLVTHRGW
jgi:hypothetical protein